MISKFSGATVFIATSAISALAETDAEYLDNLDMELSGLEVAEAAEQAQRAEFLRSQGFNQSQIEEILSGELSIDESTHGLMLNELVFGTERALTDGLMLDFRTQAEYRKRDSDNALAVGANLDLSFGFGVGSGVLAVGTQISGEYHQTWGSDIWFNPYVAYQWRDNKVSVGNVRSSYDLIIPVFNDTASFKNQLDGPRPLGVRFDSVIGADLAFSVSANEHGDVTAGIAFPIFQGDIIVSAATSYLRSIDFSVSAIGASGQQDRFGYRVQLTTDSNGNGDLEGQISYDISDRLKATGYVGLPLSGISDIAYAAVIEYGISDSVSLTGGLEHTGASTELTIGVMFNFGIPRRPVERSDLIIHLSPQLVRDE